LFVELPVQVPCPNFDVCATVPALSNFLAQYTLLWADNVLWRNMARTCNLCPHEQKAAPREIHISEKGTHLSAEAV